MTSRLIPLAEAHKINGRSAKWWSRRREAIGYVKDGGIFFREEDINRYLSERYTPPAPRPDPRVLLDQILGPKRKPRASAAAQRGGK